MVRVISRTTGCLFCGNENGRFTTEEHVLLYALGNRRDSGLVDDEIVIPPGVVCDKCNRRRLSLYDNALAQWPPISVFRTLGLLPNRKDRLVDAVERTRWTLSRDPRQPLFVELAVDADTDAGSRRDDVARHLCKIAVEARYPQDPDDACSPRWDEIAAAAIGGPLPDVTAMGLTVPRIEEAILNPKCTLHVDPNSPTLRIVCEAWIAGVRFLLLVRGPALDIPDTHWWIVDPASGMLRGPDSISRRFGCLGTSTTRLPPLHTEPQPGRASRLPTGSEHVRVFVMPDQTGRPVEP